MSSQIYPQYEVMRDKGRVDRMLIVSSCGVSTDAQEFIDDWRHASHQTYDELAESVFGLRPYITHLAELRPTEQTEYVEARLEGFSDPAIAVVEDWLQNDGGPSRAILGGYGQGKSSFARRLAAHFARINLQDPTARIPILLRLGEIVHETQLEGLFGKEFTSRFPCVGYQYPTLEYLNKQGRLFIILDGFDEMKHAMTAADFLNNFREFNKLLVGKAKVLLLGRPNALPSDERELVFRGLVRVGDQLVASSDYQAWPEWKIAFFDEQESSRLLTSSLRVNQIKHVESKRFAYQPDFVETRRDEIFALVPADLLRRPVHVQLVADVAADPQFDLRGFNEHRLYEHFISNMVQRDTVLKPARRSIALDARLQFQRELAWWAWRKPDGTQGSFYRRELPAILFRDLPNGNSADDEGKRNEYIVSTLTEEKESGVLFFAHRSFQEFLVAERMRLVKPSPASHAEYSSSLTDDVAAFLVLAPDQGFILDWYTTLQGAAGPIALGYLEFFASFPSIIHQITEHTLSRDPIAMDVWSAIILHHATRKGTQGAFDREYLSEVMLGLVKQGNAPTAAAAALSLLALCNNDGARQEPLRAQIVGAVMERCLRMARGDTAKGKLLVSKSDADFATEWMATLEKTASRRDVRMDMTIACNYETLERMCALQLQGKSNRSGMGVAPVNPITLKDVPQGIGPVHDISSAQVFKNIEGSFVKQHGAYLRAKKDAFDIVQVELRARNSRN
ncbi:MAG: NACHT domain-containing protein [Hydrogenophaga sp.]|uniref:NACHT domain-containing protein n=1 Tax=Hydrogenophaga sp. TaxID=1904254 RepID=UPI0025BC954D|nr:NACHT domain-containing protein [Hydrogenophaga sp.]MBU7572618.1 NACHT domain-containing protein [Hydrogenophaga sp.]